MSSVTGRVRESNSVVLTGFLSLYKLRPQMKRVTGIGGVFFKAKDPKALCAWYQEHLGIDVQDWGGAAFPWTDETGKPTKGTTAWCVNDAQGDSFAPSQASFMVNY